MARFDRQQSKYGQYGKAWDLARVLDQVGTQDPVSDPPGDGWNPLTNAYWVFDQTFDASLGLSFANVRFKPENVDVASALGVFSAIDFRGIAIVLRRGLERRVVRFDVNAAIRPGTQVVVSRMPDELYAEHEKVQRGIKLDLHNDVGWDGGPPLVRFHVRMSLVTRGPSADIDPPGTVAGAYLYPQLTLRWERLPDADDSEVEVAEFLGSVRMVLNLGNHLMGTSGLVSSLYTDRDVSPAMGGLDAMEWQHVFDYFSPDVQREKEFLAVKGSGDLAEMLRVHRRERPVSPPGHHEFRKYFRQAAYDNVHSHGIMHPDPDLAGNRTVHGPFCVHSCFHLHWRWGSGAAQASTGRLAEGNCPRSHRWHGWAWGDHEYPERRIGTLTPGPTALQSHDRSGQPLVPPNQEITVALTRPSSVLINGDPEIDFVDPGATLPGDEKAIWYRARIFRPPAGQRQVVLEQGGALAIEVNPDMPYLVELGFRMVANRLGVVDAVKIDSVPGSMGTPAVVIRPGPDSLREVIRDVYPRIRYENYPDTDNDDPANQPPNIQSRLQERIPRGTADLENA